MTQFRVDVEGLVARVKCASHNMFVAQDIDDRGVQRCSMLCGRMRGSESVDTQGLIIPAASVPWAAQRWPGQMPVLWSLVLAKNRDIALPVPRQGSSTLSRASGSATARMRRATAGSGSRT
jgi:hypothetical protein